MLTLKSVDHALIEVFTDQWFSETNTFHMLFGEVMITLHDVHEILGLGIDSDNMGICMSIDEIKQLLVDLFGFTTTEANSFWKKGGIPTKRLMDWLTEMRVDDTVSAEQVTSVWLMLALGITFFLDKSGGSIMPCVVSLIHDHIHTPYFSWGTGLLAHFYRGLGEASRSACNEINDFSPLL